MNTQVLPVNEESIALAAKLLQQGELVALPTETVYGIAADARNGEAVKKIFEAKGRPQDNPLIVHICGMEMLHGIVSEVPERAKKLAAAFWPGPLTMVMPRGPEVSEVTCAGLDTVGVRMPSHPVVQAVIKASGVAFAAPSANLSGKPSPTNAQDVFTDMDGRLPLILDGGECDVGVESTVISVVGEKPTLFRPGHITLEDLERALGEEVEVSKAILEKLPEGAVVRSPGMKYKHYAPKADVTLLDGTFEQLDGTVTSVTGTDALSTGNLLTRTVTIAVQNAGGLTTAQAATASINGVSSIGSATFGYQAERTLTAQAAGTVTSIHVQEGQTVAKDDILIELSGDDLTESIQSASETLRSAEISLQNLQDTMANYTVTSPISGTIIEKDAKVGDAVKSGDTLCVIYDLSYLEMVINVDELQIGALSVGQKVQLTADAVTDKTYVGTVTRVSMKGSSSGGTTTYPITIRIDNTDGLRPGMNANAEIVVAEAGNALVVPNAAVIRGGYVLVSKKSPSAANAVEDMDAPDGYVYVKVETGVSDDSYTEIKSGLQEDDTVAYDTSSVSDDYYSDSYSDSIW